MLSSGFYTKNAPRFRVKGEFDAPFFTSFEGMAYTGGGRCRLSKEQVLTCARWIEGKRPKGFFKPEDLDSFNAAWVKEDEHTHPQYLGPSIMIEGSHLDECCERIYNAE